MKHQPRFAVTERRTRIGLYLNQQLRDLEAHSQSQHRDRAAALITAIHECLEQELLDRGFNEPATLSIEVEAEPAPAVTAPAVTEAEMAQADAYLEAHAGDMIQAQTDYNALLEQQEQGVTDEVGTKV